MAWYFFEMGRLFLGLVPQYVIIALLIYLFSVGNSIFFWRFLGKSTDPFVPLQIAANSSEILRNSAAAQPALVKSLTGVQKLIFQVLRGVKTKTRFPCQDN